MCVCVLHAKLFRVFLPELVVEKYTDIFFLLLPPPSIPPLPTSIYVLQVH